MHYDFKQKLNKIDSNAYTGLKIPEIDRVLNRALNMYILLIAKPRLKSTSKGFEKIQRTIDDLRPLISNNHELEVVNSNSSEINYSLDFTNYLYYLSTAKLLCSKGGVEKELNTIVIKHDDRNINSVFFNSDFEWGECNIRFFNYGIKVFTNNFTVKSFSINYITKHPYIHNAENFIGGKYLLPTGKELTGYQDCILDEITHDEIVDLAVLLTTNDLVLSDSYQMKKDVSIMKQIINN